MAQWRVSDGMSNDSTPPLRDHDHDIEFIEQRPVNGATSLIRFRLGCGCGVRDIRDFAEVMNEQRGWNIRRTSGYGGTWSPISGDRTFYCYVQTKTL
jgi:hypothetical protein